MFSIWSLYVGLPSTFLPLSRRDAGELRQERFGHLVGHVLGLAELAVLPEIDVELARRDPGDAGLVRGLGRDLRQRRQLVEPDADADRRAHRPPPASPTGP